MKNSLVYFKKNLVSPYDELKIIEEIFSPKGILFDSVSVISIFDDLSFKRQISSLKQTTDNIFVFVEEDMEFDYKSIISEVFDRQLFESDRAIKLLEEYADKNGGEINTDFAYLPIDATVIPNSKTAFQGYMVEDDECTLVVLPTNSSVFRDMCVSFVIPYFENKYALKTEKFTFKYFGSIQAVKKAMDLILLEYENAFTYRINGKDGDHLIEMEFLIGKEDLKPSVLRSVVSSLKENIYAEFDTTLSERLFDLLKLKNIKISVAESFTAGRVVSSIISNSGASRYVHEGVVSYSNLSKSKRLGVKECDLSSVGAVSAEVAYQMAKGLLVEGVDLAISTTGIAGPKSDDTLKPVGLSYIGIGMKDGIHVYKYVFSGDRETITETAKNTALFLAIKKLKNLR